VSASNRGADMVWVVPCRVRSALLTSLDGLPSDELFAIPATRTASVYVESSGLEKTETLPPVRAGLNHDLNPTHLLPPAPAATRITKSVPRQGFAKARPWGEQPSVPTTASVC